MSRTLFLVALCAVCLQTSLAHADESRGNDCAGAYVRAQTLRNDRKLIDARNALRVCVQPTCKDFIVKDCVNWLDQTQASLPTVVPVATDRDGNDLAGVVVEMDGKPLLERIDGHSIEVDPGAHTFTFFAPDGTKTVRQVLISEGEKGKPIGVEFGQAKPSALEADTIPAPPRASASWAWVSGDISGWARFRKRMMPAATHKVCARREWRATH
jgi:hypothetical protein